jgi:hypothetical protein
LLVVGVCLAMLSATASVASAAADPGWYDSLSSAEQQTEVDQLYTEFQGTAPNGTDGGDVFTRSRDVLKAAPDLVQEEVAKEEVQLGTRAKLFTPLVRVLSTRGATIALTGTTVGTGFVIYEVAGPTFKRWFKYKIPQPPLEAPYSSTPELRPQIEGSPLPRLCLGQSTTCGANPPKMPYDGYVLRWWQTAPTANFWQDRDSYANTAGAPYCDQPGGPSGYDVFRGPYDGATCSLWMPDDTHTSHYENVPVRFQHYLRRELDPRVPPASPDAPGGQPPTVTGQPPPDPGVDTVGPAVKTAIDGDGFDLIRAERDWQRYDGVDTMGEPYAHGYPYIAPPAENEDRWCEYSAPGNGYAAVNPDAAMYDVWREYAISVQFPSASGLVPMYYGTDSAKPNPSLLVDKIVGFGVRKVAAKHGYGPQDEAETQTALAAGISTLVNPVAFPGRYRFVGPSYDPPDPSRILASMVPVGKKVVCNRVVIVDTEPLFGAPQARGIITSYGRYDIVDA